LLVRVGVGRPAEAPDALLIIKGGLRGCPAVTGFLRVAVSNTCRSSRPVDQPTQGASGRSPAASSRRFRSDSCPSTHRAYVQHSHAVPGLLRHLGGRDAVVVEVDELTGVYKNTTRGIVAWSSAASRPAAPSARQASRPPSSGSPPTRSASAWQRSSPSGSGRPGRQRPPRTEP
jgi:hypothetical protein